MFWIITKRRHAREIARLRTQHTRRIQTYQDTQDKLVMACAQRDVYLMGLRRQESKT